MEFNALEPTTAPLDRGMGMMSTIPVLLAAMVAWWFWYRLKQDRESSLPGTFGLPIVGETLAYVAKMKTPLGNFVDEHSLR